MSFMERVYFVMGFLLGIGVALLFCAQTVHAHGHPSDSVSEAEAPCSIEFVVTDGEVLATKTDSCPTLLMGVTFTEIQIHRGEKIISLRLPSGWGVGSHHILYTIGEDTYTWDEYTFQVKVRART